MVPETRDADADAAAFFAAPRYSIILAVEQCFNQAVISRRPSLSQNVRNVLTVPLIPSSEVFLVATEENCEHGRPEQHQYVQKRARDRYQRRDDAHRDEEEQPEQKYKKFHECKACPHEEYGQLGATGGAAVVAPDAPRGDGQRHENGEIQTQQHECDDGSVQTEQAELFNGMIRVDVDLWYGCDCRGEERRGEEGATRREQKNWRETLRI